MKSRLGVLLLSITAVCGFYAVSVLAGAQDPPAPPTPPAPPSVVPVPPVPPSPPMVPVYASAPSEPPALPAPAIPPMPAMPAAPLAPASPAEPGWGDWDHRHSVSMSGGHHEPATDCSDLHVRFDDRDAVMETEERTLTKAEAPTLRVRPHTNGGVQVEGWDKDNYSVRSCKFASNEDGGARRMLAQIALSVQNGEVSTNGPSGEGDWTVYLLIRAPKASVIDLETANGPLSLYSVDGKLTAHATNGPITLRDFSGDADVRAANGPITISGSSGNVRIHTENGPISINNRRIEFGASPAMIRLSTVNGPVSIQSSREEM